MRQNIWFKKSTALQTLTRLHAQTAAWTSWSKLGMPVGFDICN